MTEEDRPCPLSHEPNEETERVLQEVLDGKNLNRSANLEELFKDLGMLTDEEKALRALDPKIREGFEDCWEHNKEALKYLADK